MNAQELNQMHSRPVLTQEEINQIQDPILRMQEGLRALGSLPREPIGFQTLGASQEMVVASAINQTSKIIQNH